jgi:hypothetical protein
MLARGLKENGWRMHMMAKFPLTALLALVVCAPAERAAAQNNTLGGAIVGGVGGAIVGGALGGSRGAAVGAVIGAGTGAAIGAQGEPRPGGYRYYQNGCYVQQGDGSWVGVSPRYCQTVEYAPRERYVPQQRVYDDAPACTRSRSYNPRTGTVIGRDGYERPCP